MSPVLFNPELLLPNLRQFLIDNDIGRLPRTDDPTLPPIWADPKRGIPYPGQTQGLGPNEDSEDLVLALYPSTGIVSQPFEGFLVTQSVDLYYRGRNSLLIAQKHEQVRTVLHDKRNFLMNSLLVNEAMMVRENQRVGADEEGYVYNCQYQFSMWNPNWQP